MEWKELSDAENSLNEQKSKLPILRFLIYFFYFLNNL